jgi:hypothetical protein
MYGFALSVKYDIAFGFVDAIIDAHVTLVDNIPGCVRLYA